MKKLILPTLALALTLTSFQSCTAQKVVINREIESTNDGPMLLGFQSRSQFLKAPYVDWYQKEYEEYAPHTESLALLKKEKLNSFNITAVLGTWCDDSHREIPRLLKILDAVGYPENKITFLAVNRKKESPNGDEGPMNIQKVPTIIVYKYGKEVGRIVEMPNSGWLEKDLIEILKKDNGKSALQEIFKK